MSRVETADRALLRARRSSARLERQVKPVALAILGWGALVVISTTTVFITNGGESLAEWARPLRRITTYYYLWAIASVVVYRFIDRFPFKASRLPWLIPAHTMLMAVFALVVTVLVHGSVWRYWLLGAGAIGFQSLTASIYLFVVVGCLFLRDYRAGLEQERIAQEMKLRASLLESRLQAAKLDALRMQINPHFLFNALNSIASLIETRDNDEAYRTIELLGGLLRTILDQSRESMTTVAEEVDFVRRFVEIEKIRFGDRLRFLVDVDPRCADEAIPALILQPIVENSIKHAVVPSEERVEIRLRCALVEDRIELSVEDDGPGFSGERSDRAGGLGLNNVRHRLELLSGDSADLRIESIPDTGTAVTIQLRRHDPAPRPEISSESAGSRSISHRSRPGRSRSAAPKKLQIDEI